MNWPVVAQNPEVLAERSWGYATETNQDGTKRFKQFYKELEQKKLQLSIMADDKTSYNNLMNDMSEIFDYDIRNRKPGEKSGGMIDTKKFISQLQIFRNMKKILMRLKTRLRYQQRCRGGLRRTM